MLIMSIPKIMLDKGISKYEGLLKIEWYGLPHPKWIFIKDATGLGEFLDKEVKHGWTVRSCLKSGKSKLNLPYVNKAFKEEVPKRIETFKKQLGNDAIFVIYPSWEFVKSGNCMLKEHYCYRNDRWLLR